MPFLHLVEKALSLTKAILFQRKTVSNFLKGLLFQKKAVLVPSQPLLISKISMKQFENRSPFKRCYKFTFEKQNFAFQSTKCFQTKDLLARFCFKRFWFYPESQILFKMKLTFKKWFATDLLNKILRKDFVGKKWKCFFSKI